MAQSTGIEWTDATWNPTTGCTKISPGCKFCYAELMAGRLKLMGQEHYKDGFELRLHEDSVNLPLKWRKPKKIFVNSMSDLYHADVPLEFIHSVHSTMVKATWHTFQVLTKRSGRAAELAAFLAWPKNVWMGVSVESPAYEFRIDDLRRIPAAVRFLSLEPLIAPIPQLNLEGIDWVIVGGESGPHSRPMQTDWVREIHEQCVTSGVPFFFKQWGGTRKKKSGRLLDGHFYTEWPTAKDRQRV